SASTLDINYSNNNQNDNIENFNVVGTEEDEYTGIKWAGDNPIPCEIPVPDTQVIYEELAVESRMRVSFYLGLISWMYLHLRVDVHSGIQTQYRSLLTPSRYPLSL
ncbi:unnamed protein product, partial [Schistosoma curassoni]|uniref:MAM domain-containing protein n=1 Tax=Schistosoma curassoni TaxID=6186 RepID=A0A183K2J4_9TREM